MSTTIDICIIGGGPAGSVLGIRLAQLGWSVCLIERAVFPRAHLGECLSAGVLPLLASIGAGALIERAGFPHTSRVRVDWDKQWVREEPDGSGIIVDRGRFDSLLLDYARSCGVLTLQPATVEQRRHHDRGWNLAVSTRDRKFELETRFLADASGRGRPAQTLHTGARTLSLHAYWKGTGLPDHPRIEAGRDHWFWGVPLPGGLYNTMVFLDARGLRALPGDLASKFRNLLAGSSLLPPGARAKIAGKVHAVDATPYLAEQPVTEDSIRVGDSALALDPLSSTGVQKAIQSAMAASVVVNTLLLRPATRALAEQFYHDSLSQAFRRHQTWARERYAQVAARWPTEFWLQRAGSVSSSEDSPSLGPDFSGTSDAPLRLAQGVKLVQVPCAVDRFIESRPAVSCPSLETPVAFVGDWAVAPLLENFREGATARQLAQSWTARIPPSQGLAIAQWLVSRGVLVPGSDRATAVKGRR